jgi:hypothetical protein
MLVLTLILQLYDYLLTLEREVLSFSMGFPIVVAIDVLPILSHRSPSFGSQIGESEKSSTFSRGIQHWLIRPGRSGVRRANLPLFASCYSRGAFDIQSRWHAVHRHRCVLCLRLLSFCVQREIDRHACARTSQLYVRADTDSSQILLTSYEQG